MLKIREDLRPKSYQSLQALRAAAAILVVLYHANISIFGTVKYWSVKPIGLLLDFGHAGVEFFFVLSGYIMVVAHASDIRSGDHVWSFVWKRFRRIYPAYWALLVVVTPVYILVPSFGLGHERGLGVILDSAALVHFSGQYRGVVLTVSWTLFHEVLFYAVFALLLFKGRIGTIAMGAWVAGSLFAALHGPPLPPQLAFFLSPLHLLFAMGMCAAWVNRSTAVPIAAGVALAGLGLFAGTGCEEVYVGAVSLGGRTMLYGFGSTLAIIGAVELERTGRLRIPRACSLIGDASYSIYLVHILVLSVLGKVVMVGIGRDSVPPLVIYVALVVLAVGAGVLYHLIVERPLLQLFGHSGGRSAIGRISTTMGPNVTARVAEP